MVSHLFFYQLVLIALVWFFLLLHYAWPHECANRPRSAEPELLTPKRPRSKAPAPFAGLTQRPPCALCEREAAHAPDEPPAAHRGYLAALLPPWGLSLSRLARAGQSAR